MTSTRNESKSRFKSRFYQELFDFFSTETFLDLLNYYKRDFPKKEDMEGAVAAIGRLQEVYNLKPFDFTEGKYGPTAGDFGKLVTTMDSFTIGRASYVAGDYKNCAKWMLEALRLLDSMQPNTAEGNNPPRKDILDYLAYSEYKVGCHRSYGYQQLLLGL